MLVAFGEQLLFWDVIINNKPVGILKYDGYRKKNHWTAIDETGRLGDYSDSDTAVREFLCESVKAVEIIYKLKKLGR